MKFVGHPMKFDGDPMSHPVKFGRHLMKHDGHPITFGGYSMMFG